MEPKVLRRKSLCECIWEHDPSKHAPNQIVLIVPCGNIFHGGHLNSHTYKTVMMAQYFAEAEPA